MSSSTSRRTRRMQFGGATLLVWALVGLALAAQDVGFTVISEGVVEEREGAAFDLTLYGIAGIGAASSFWATGGARATFTVEGFDIHADASAGTDGIRVKAGSQIELYGFRVAGDVTWSPSTTPVIDLRAWGSLDQIQLTVNARLAGSATTVSVGASSDFGGYGLSGNLAIAGGTLATASVGANTALGALALSLSGGWSGGRFNAGGGLGIEVGSFNLAANAGFDTGLGVNATASASLVLDAVQATAVAMLDNTGFGLEATGEIALGSMTATFMGRFGGASLTLEVGGRLPLGKALATGSIAFDTQGGFSWAEIGFEMPL